MITTLLLDFGGVIAEEGFYAGLLAIGKRNRRDPERFFRDVERIIFESGYLIGRTGEAFFWDAVRRETGITGSNAEFREEILGRFSLRPEMLAVVDRSRQEGLTAAMLSDQTNWLEEIDARTPFLGHFDHIFNSFRLHKSKRDPSVFTEVCDILGVPPGSILFVDDNAGHIERAAGRGLLVHHFTASGTFQQALAEFTGEKR